MMHRTDKMNTLISFSTNLPTKSVLFHEFDKTGSLVNSHSAYL